MISSYFSKDRPALNLLKLLKKNCLINSNRTNIPVFNLFLLCRMSKEVIVRITRSLITFSLLITLLFTRISRACHLFKSIFRYNPINRTSPESPLRSPTHPPHQENYYPGNNFGQMSPYGQFIQENSELEENFYLNPQPNSFNYNHPNYNNINRAGSTDPYQFVRENPKMFQSQFDNNNINRKPSYPPM